MRAIAGLALAACCSTAAHGAGRDEPKPSLVRAERLIGHIRFDGQLNEAAWSSARALTQFWEIYPSDRGKPNEATSARFLYDDRFIYVGLRAELREPKDLRAPFVRRDLVNSSQDYVQVYLDPLGSRRSSYLFRVNARGSRADSLQDELKQTEVADPDFDWEVRTSVDQAGWSAELRIPLSTLRVPHPGAQDWTIVVYRGVPRKQNVQMASAPIPRVASCFLCFGGTLHLDDLRPGRENLLVTPSVVGTLEHGSGALGTGSDVRVTPSLDVKWLPYAGAALDLTVNPDFSQTEADAAQLTANQRFAINFPEKRPFFREGSDLITLPIPLLATRTVVAPNVGLRFTHRSEAVNGTVFVADDDGDGVILEPEFLSSGAGAPRGRALVGFARGRASVGEFDIGAIVVSKRLSGAAANTLAGIDASWGNGPDRVTAQLVHAVTRNPNDQEIVATWDGRHLRGNAAVAQWDHNGDAWAWQARYALYDRGFRSWLGYVPRVGYQEAFVKLLKPTYPNRGPLNEISPYASFGRLDGLHVRGTEHDLALGLQIAGPLGGSLDLSVHPTSTVLTEAGAARRTRSLQWKGSINPVRWIPRLALAGTFGTTVDFLTGERVRALIYDAAIQVRPFDRLTVELRRGATRLSGNPAGGLRLNETITEITAAYFFGARLYFSASHQIFDTRRTYPARPHERSTLTNLQLSWETSRNLSAYLGVRSGADRGALRENRGRSTEAYIKLSRTFRLHL